MLCKFEGVQGTDGASWVISKQTGQQQQQQKLFLWHGWFSISANCYSFLIVATLVYFLYYDYYSGEFLP